MKITDLLTTATSSANFDTALGRWLMNLATKLGINSRKALVTTRQAISQGMLDSASAHFTGLDLWQQGLTLSFCEVTRHQ